MKKIIEQQLKKCEIAQIGSFNSSTKEIFIKKYCELKIEVDCCYLIELKDFITNPPPTSTLAINWNNGSIPKYRYYKCDVTKKMGNMIRINAIAFDYEHNKDINEMWSGWLPLDGIIIMQKI